MRERSTASRLVKTTPVSSGARHRNPTPTSLREPGSSGWSRYPEGGASTRRRGASAANEALGRPKSTPPISRTSPMPRRNSPWKLRPLDFSWDRGGMAVFLLAGNPPDPPGRRGVAQSSLNRYSRSSLVRLLANPSSPRTSEMVWDFFCCSSQIFSSTVPGVMRR